MFILHALAKLDSVFPGIYPRGIKTGQVVDSKLFCYFLYVTGYSDNTLSILYYCIAAKVIERQSLR